MMNFLGFIGFIILMILTITILIPQKTQKMKKEEFKSDIPKEFIQKQPGQPSLLTIIIIVVAVVGAGYFLNTRHNKTQKLPEPAKKVSIYEYHNMEARVAYLEYKNMVKEVIIHDLLLKKGVKIDSAYLLEIGYHVSNFMTSPKKVNPKPVMTPEWKAESAYRLDSLCANWLESIPFMIMMEKEVVKKETFFHGQETADSADVLNSETYKTMKVDILDKLRQRKLEVFNGKMPKMP
jgi:preprotein translocase subunit YajC